MKFLLFASSFYLFIHSLCFSTNKNIILFITDDQSPDAGCYGNKKIKVEYLNFIQDPIDQILENQKDGYDVLELVVPAKSGGMQSEYIAVNKSKEIPVELLITLDSSMALL